MWLLHLIKGQVSRGKFFIQVRIYSELILTITQIPWYYNEEFTDIALYTTITECQASTIKMDAIISITASKSPLTVSEASLIILEEIRVIRRDIGVSKPLKLHRFPSDKVSVHERPL